MTWFKNFLSQRWVKAILVVVSVALPQILPLLPPGNKGAAILGAIYGFLVSLGIIAPPAASSGVVGSTFPPKS